MSFKSCIRSLLVGLSLVACVCRADMAPLEAMNMAGLQRTLGQILAKDYMMIGSDVKADVATRQRQETLALFEDHHRKLVAYAPNDAIRAALNEVGTTWQTYRGQVMGAPTKTGAVQVFTTAETLVKQCQHVTDLFEQHNGDAASHSINRSGWNRVLTQRIALLYIARAWGVQAPLDDAFDASVKEFGGILAELQAEGAPNDAIAKSLRKTEARWMFVSEAFSAKEFMPNIVAVNADSLFRQLNELTRLYAGLNDNTL
ncbi:type IV pili methyl-accepting chemotaxis transducer N-terminal domain-containing protein [Pseudomonas sp. Marseille-QA0892]